MTDIAAKFKELNDSVPESVSIVAVSKTRSLDEIMTLYNTGHRILGENRVQELVAKKEKLPDDIEWHLIGHLQSNKVKYIAGFITLVHSIDSIKLLKVVSKEGLKAGRVIDCLLQVHIATEESKFGFSGQEIAELATHGPGTELEGIRIRGLMGMASFSDDEHLVRNEFATLKRLYDNMKNGYFSSNLSFDTLSMGMSSDYRIAIDEGSNMIRVGSSIFGDR